jgi:hypothetical protein
VIGWGRIGGKQRQKEWIIMGRKISWEGDQWIVAQERGESEEGKNRDKKIVMVKLTTQEKKNRYSNKKFSLLGKSSGLIPLVSNPGIGAWYSGLCWGGCCPFLLDRLVWEDGWSFFPCFPWSYGLSITSRSSEVVSSDDWLVISNWFLQQGRLQLGPEVTHYRFVQGGLMCYCFHQAAAVLPYSCNSVWSAPPPTRWGNSILSTASVP